MVVLNRIYTRTGDDGTTALGSGDRRKKYDLRVAAYGEVIDRFSQQYPGVVLRVILADQFALRDRELRQRNVAASVLRKTKSETRFMLCNPLAPCVGTFAPLFEISNVRSEIDRHGLSWHGRPCLTKQSDLLLFARDDDISPVIPQEYDPLRTTHRPDAIPSYFKGEVVSPCPLLLGRCGILQSLSNPTVAAWKPTLSKFLSEASLEPRKLPRLSVSKSQSPLRHAIPSRQT